MGWFNLIYCVIAGGVFAYVIGRVILSLIWRHDLPDRPPPSGTWP